MHLLVSLWRTQGTVANLWALYDTLRQTPNYFGVLPRDLIGEVNELLISYLIFVFFSALLTPFLVLL